MEVDYSGVEVRIAACYHKDPTMLKYLHDPESDMHRDVAADLFILPHDQVTKALRQGGKNGFVFPQFYGDYYGNNAPHIWQEWVVHPYNGRLLDGKSVRAHLARYGIRTLEQYTEHVKKVENNFWNKRFRVYGKWRRQHVAAYNQRGFFRSLTGFIYKAPMGKNDATNYGIQGSAFHCLLDSLVRLDKELCDGNWKSFIIGQIHDAINLCVWPPELPKLIPLVRKIMVDDLMQKWKWINCQLDVEFDLGRVDASWYEIKTISERPSPCVCGLEWGYKEKDGGGNVQFVCPICESVSEKGEACNVVV